MNPAAFFLQQTQDMLQQQEGMKIKLNNCHSENKRLKENISELQVINVQLNSVISKLTKCQNQYQSAQIPSSYVLKLQEKVKELIIANEQWEIYFRKMGKQVQERLKPFNLQIQSQLIEIEHLKAQLQLQNQITISQDQIIVDINTYHQLIKERNDLLEFKKSMLNSGQHMMEIEHVSPLSVIAKEFESILNQSTSQQQVEKNSLKQYPDSQFQQGDQLIVEQMKLISHIQVQKPPSTQQVVGLITESNPDLRTKAIVQRDSDDLKIDLEDNLLIDF